MSFLVSAKPATAGVMNGLDTSDLPMCFMEISEDGILKSFQSNKLAKEMYLTGLETRRYQISDKKGGDDRTYLVLFWQKRKLQQ
ncbi:hypothetical protein HII31_12072 [Pseudocercospora fuligena]|uniref:Uncharacterized protein n=1 Tax=Pseudocercospora fuligena TaxID=685502 RepID=A0A8H6R8W2_9PEZI|nr:hypothetical protein HII31_12072 [Pseudocercospora fuligena]